MELPKVSRRVAKAWWRNRSGTVDVDETIDDYVEFLASSGYTGGDVVLALARYATPRDDLSLVGTWVLQELALSQGREALLPLRSVQLSDAQRAKILSGFRPPWEVEG